MEKLEQDKPIHFYINDLINSYKNEDKELVKIKINKLKRLVGGFDYPHLNRLLDYIEGQTTKVDLPRHIRTLSPSYFDGFFALLRDEYANINKKAIKNKKRSVKSERLYNFSFIDNARLIIYWGKRNKQIIGKDLEPIDIAVYDKVTSSKRKIEIKSYDCYRDFYIVTPSYNSVKYIDATILSVISQEGPFRIYYHVQDGGSDDGTIEKLEKWKERITDKDRDLIKCEAFNFSFESKPDKGMYDAINCGFSNLKIPENGICTWINSDDILLPGSLASVQEVFHHNHDSHWIIGATNGRGQHLQEISKLSLHFPDEIISKGLCDGKHWRFIQQEGTFWKHFLWKEVSGIDKYLKYCGDWNLWRKFAQLTSPIHIDWPLGCFRMHESQLTASIQYYYEEMNGIISENERKKGLEELKNNHFNKIKVIKRPHKKNAVPEYKFEKLAAANIPYLNQPSTDKIIKHVVNNSVEKPIKVLTLSTIARGGAGTGTVRRIKALRDIGVDAKLVSLIAETTDAYIGRIQPVLDGLKTDNQYDNWEYLLSNIRNKFMNSSHFVGQELFSSTESLLNMKQLMPLIDNVDVLHFHWIVGMLNYDQLPQTLKRKPIVWTTGDMNPFTGGCHYSEGCEEFIHECRNCPLLSGKSNIPHENWKIKRNVYEKLNISVVCPSEYIANMARKSSLFGDKPIQVIANAYPIDNIFPVSRDKARKKFGLPKNKKLLLFGAEDVTNLRKGGDLLVKIAEELSKSPYSCDLEIVFFGNGNIELPIKTNYLGSVNQDLLSYVYSAVDIFISLSREDVGPMTIVESLLCSTPVVSFSIGVAPEVVQHQSTGYIVKPFDLDGVIKGIDWSFKALKDDPGIGQRCRSSAVNYADPKKSAEKHKELYEKLLG